MTNKEAKEIIESECYVFNPLNFDRSTMINTALDMAIQAMEQEPCEDAVSRQAVEKITWEEPSYSDALNVLTEVRDKVRALPSVTLTRKKGKWLNNDASGYHFYGKCSECGQEFCVDAWYTQNMKFCPNCGAEMESEE